jgi:hypothetical protein
MAFSAYHTVSVLTGSSDFPSSGSTLMMSRLSFGMNEGSKKPQFDFSLPGSAHAVYRHKPTNL